MPRLPGRAAGRAGRAGPGRLSGEHGGPGQPARPSEPSWLSGPSAHASDAGPGAGRARQRGGRWGGADLEPPPRRVPSQSPPVPRQALDEALRVRQRAAAGRRRGGATPRGGGGGGGGGGGARLRRKESASGREDGDHGRERRGRRLRGAVACGVGLACAPRLGGIVRGGRAPAAPRAAGGGWRGRLRARLERTCDEVTTGRSKGGCLERMWFLLRHAIADNYKPATVILGGCLMRALQGRST